jgi:hypothetical protein
MPSPPATPPVRRCRPPERGRLPPRCPPRPPPHTPRVGLLPILLLRAFLPGLRGSTAVARRVPCRPVVSSCWYGRLKAVLPNASRGAPRAPALTDTTWLTNWVLLTQAN